MSEPTVLLLGSTDRPEFSEARSVLEGLARVIPVPGVAAAAAVLANEQLAVDVIVVAQAYPGQFCAEAVERLGRLAPLARFVALLGSWCEGEARSGRPWAGAVRVAWHQWPARCRRELGRFRQGLCNSWSLPPTATEEERFLSLADQPFLRREGAIAIRSRAADMRDWLLRACRLAGYSCIPEEDPGLVAQPPDVAQPPSAVPFRGFKAALFDAIDCRGEELDEIRRLAAAVTPAPVIVLMSFPRREDRDRALAAGASAVLSKPLVLEDLYGQLDRAGETTKDQ